MELSDKTILELQEVLDAAIQGDSDAFGGLVTRFESRFRSLVKKMLFCYPGVHRWEDTDDVYQAAVIRLHQSLSGARPESVRAFVGLAATQVRRTLIDLARHYSGAHGLGANYQSAGAGRAADDPGAVVDKEAAKKQPDSLDDWTAFHEATQRLPDESREVFDLVWYAGLQQTEAAELLNVSRRTIIRRLNLARKLLTEMLAE